MTACATTTPHGPHEWFGEALRNNCPGVTDPVTDARDVIARKLSIDDGWNPEDWDDDSILNIQEHRDYYLGKGAAVVAALAAAGLSITATPASLRDVRDNEGNYYGKQGTPHEHRTVGDYRAWCYDAHEWCYPSDPCHLCKELSDV